MGSMGEMISRLGLISVGMGEKQLAGIDAKVFARKARGEGGRVIDSNHPAFVFGHLALYPAGWLPMLGLDPGLCSKPAGFEDLFAAGKECRDDPDRTIYPSMETITSAFFATHKPVLEAIAKVDDAVFARENPREQSRARFPTIGFAMTFYVTSHMMLHFGQVSMWRRAYGLGSAM
jgi:hypothetical protein